MVRYVKAIPVQQHVPAGESVWNGYDCGDNHMTAPDEEGFYTLYELCNLDNFHIGWKWVKEVE